ncbi:flagellar biosynthesis protein FlhA [Halothiobacillus sp.]|uniref:flagellar biosynthesis protein FlhA n=1 Tax=Halothiobacillus sp. TaxID=1891311 RepID=UPI002632BBA0|nr:flagellar biosynthesis protein FlhA [Halothiobacillus sp.]MDD4966763.1 flagellar biosynthesis protein FlhA [Halothiobacillus sp.]
MKALLASLDWRSAGQGIRSYRGQGIGPPLIIVMLLAMVVVPLPPLALDALFTFNITLSIVILMVTIYVMRPLDFAVFPTVILMATLLRLALNVASTRVVLLHGQNGPDAAGHVIGSFGEFVIGGNYAVGIVVFIILMLINFVVVTKGAGRVSEVTARFTLDALPGKQMAIDADLNAGIINQEQAKLRREEVASEADFYGSMDGASKFVRGDAVAGILIVFINVFGGLLIGVLQHGMPFGQAAQTYVLLTIGDGLVATIPSLLISTATAIIVTRVASSQDMGKQVQTQMFSDPRVLGVAAGLMAGLGVIPGMPNVAFLTLAALAGFGAYLIARKKQEKAQLEAQQQAVPDKKPELKELTWDDVPPVDVIGLEVGYGLIPLVDRNQGGQLMPRIKGVRKKISQDLGFLVSAVHIRDNLDLKPGEYRISINGVPMGVAEIYADRDMAINPGQVSGPIAGIKTIDPAFGLEAYWIERNTKEHAQAMGYTVVDPATVIATHLSQILTENAADLFGYEEAQQLIDTLKEGAPKLVEDLVPKTLGMTTIVQVLRNLLEERLPIRDIRTIAETLARHGQHTQDVSQLTEVVRIALGRMIVQHINGLSPTLPVITLDPQLEQLLLNSTQRPNGGQDGTPGIEPGLAERLHQSLREAAEKQEQVGQPSILLVAPQIRSWLARMVRYSIRQLHVLSYNEIPDNKDIKVVASVGNQRAVA